MNKLPSGFTLIELLIVLAIISILAVLGTYGYTAALKISRDTKRQADLKVIQAALEQYHADNHFYPPQPLSFPPVTQLTNATGQPTPPPVTQIYLNNIPQDPIYTALSSVYRYEPYRRDGGVCITPTDCQLYCLYAVMELGSSMIDLCPNRSGYTLEVSPP